MYNALAATPFSADNEADITHIGVVTIIRQATYAVLLSRNGALISGAPPLTALERQLQAALRARVPG